MDPRLRFLRTASTSSASWVWDLEIRPALDARARQREHAVPQDIREQVRFLHRTRYRGMSKTGAAKLIAEELPWTWETIRRHL